MKLSILIPTIPTRKSLLSRLLYYIERQLTDEVEVIIYDGMIPMGDKYTHMISIAKGDYVVCVDDDDLISHDYISLVLPKLNTDIDFLGYKILTTKNDQFWLEITHSYEYINNSWDIIENKSFRGVSVKCPIRKNIANKFIFTNEQEGDFYFIKNIEKSGEIKKFDFINKSLYMYEYTTYGTCGTSPNSQFFINNSGNQKDVGLYPYNKNNFTWIKN